MKIYLFAFAFLFGLNTLCGQPEVLTRCQNVFTFDKDTLRTHFGIPSNARPGRYYLLNTEVRKANGQILSNINPATIAGPVRFLLPGNIYQVAIAVQPSSGKPIDPFRTDHFVFFMTLMPETGGPTFLPGTEVLAIPFETPQSVGQTGTFAGLIVENETVIDAGVPGAFTGQLDDLDAGQDHAVSWNTAVTGAPNAPAPQQTMLYFVHSAARQQQLLSAAGIPDCPLPKQKHKPLTFGVLAGVTDPQWSGGDPDIRLEMGATYGADANLELRLARRLGFQVGAAYLQRSFTLSNIGSDQEYDSSHYRLFNYSNAGFFLRELRLSAHLKLLNFLQIGGYYTFPFSVTRKGPLAYRWVQNGSSTDISMEYEYNLLDEQQFPRDGNDRRPIQPDYGLSLGFELPATRRFNIGFGIQYSLRGFFNPDYGNWNTTGPATDPAFQDLYPAQSGKLQLPVAFIRFGIRI